MLGGSFFDTATITKPGVGPTPTGSVRFDVYGPGDPTCAGAPTFTSTNPLNAAGTTAVSANFTPTSAGTWKVIATYIGDANYVAARVALRRPGRGCRGDVDPAAAAAAAATATAAAAAARHHRRRRHRRARLRLARHRPVASCA